MRFDVRGPFPGKGLQYQVLMPSGEQIECSADPEDYAKTKWTDASGIEWSFDLRMDHVYKSGKLFARSCAATWRPPGRIQWSVIGTPIADTVEQRIGCKGMKIYLQSSRRLAVVRFDRTSRMGPSATVVFKDSCAEVLAVIIAMVLGQLHERH